MRRPPCTPHPPGPQASPPPQASPSAPSPLLIPFSSRVTDPAVAHFLMSPALQLRATCPPPIRRGQSKPPSLSNHSRSAGSVPGPVGVERRMRCGPALIWPPGQCGAQPGKQMGTNEVLGYSLRQLFLVLAKNRALP